MRRDLRPKEGGHTFTVIPSPEGKGQEVRRVFVRGEFVAKAFTAAGVRLFPDLNDDDVEPADFARLLSKK